MVCKTPLTLVGCHSFDEKTLETSYQISDQRPDTFIITSP